MVFHIMLKCNSPTMVKSQKRRIGLGTLQELLLYMAESLASRVSSYEQERFEANFIPHDPGRHRVDVKFNGEKVPNSPWFVEVKVRHIVQTYCVDISCRHIVQTYRVDISCRNIMQTYRVDILCRHIMQTQRVDILCRHIVQTYCVDISCRHRA